MGLRSRAGTDFEITNILDDPRFNDYWQYYHRLTERRGVTVSAAKELDVAFAHHADRRGDGGARRRPMPC